MSDDDALRAQIDRLLAGGLQTESAHRAYASDEVTATCRRLQGVPPDDVAAKLVIAGFARRPFIHPNDEDRIEQSCATCMYFERHRQFCALPELMLLVRAEWSCILWRI